MADSQNIPPHDALDLGEPFDARQWAMHGLLRVHFEDSRTRGERVDRTLRGLGIDPRAARALTPAAVNAALLALRARRRRRRRLRLLRLPWLWTSGAAAAMLFIAIIAYVTTLGPAPAVAASLRDLALQPPRAAYLLLDVDALLAGDRDQLGRIECDVEAELAERDARLPAADDGDANAANTAYHAWTRAYREMRSLGQWDNAISSMYELAAHAERYHHPDGAPSPWPYIALTDIADTHFALGDLAAAREAYAQSLAMREIHARYSLVAPKPSVRLASALIDILPLDWRLSDLALAEGNLADAAAWLGRGEPLLRDYYAAVCRASRVVIPKDADALELFERYVPAAFRDPPTEGYANADDLHRAEAVFGGFLPEGSLVAQLRAQTYRVARLKRLAGELDAADGLLQRAWAMPDIPAADDERLAYAIPLEFARLSIAHNDWNAAQTWLEVARAGTAEVIVDWDRNLNKPEIAGARRTDLTLLSALVAMKLHPEAPAGRELLTNALASIDRLAAQLDMTQREHFLDQFRAWRELRQEIEDSR